MTFFDDLNTLIATVKSGSGNRITTGDALEELRDLLVALGFEAAITASDGDLLQFGSGEWGAVKYGLMLSARRTTNQSMPNATVTTIVFDDVLFIRDGVTYNNGTGVITINLPGWYLLTANLRYENNSTGFRTVQADADGLGIMLTNAVSGGTTGYNYVSRAFQVSSSTTRSVRSQQNSGGSLNILGTNNTVGMSLYRLV
jgi:hypothetical protein